MGQRQTHRGKHPEDGKLFAPERVPVLREAVADLSFLYTRGYSDRSALKTVGDRYALDVRQRAAVSSAACSDAALECRRAHWVAPSDLAGREVNLDGYNILILAESALAGGVLLRGRDGCIRDLASIHGSYHRVEETHSAIHLIGRILQELRVAHAQWRLDSPVSNSGKLKTRLCEDAERSGWPWSVTLDPNPDKVLAQSPRVAVTSDSWILDRAQAWTSLGDLLAAGAETTPDVIELSGVDD